MTVIGDNCVGFTVIGNYREIAGKVPYTVVPYVERSKMTVIGDNVIGNTVKVTVIGVTLYEYTVLENSLFRDSYDGRPL